MIASQDFLLPRPPERWYDSDNMHLEDLKKSLRLDLDDLAECNASPFVAAAQAHVIGCRTMAASVCHGDDVIEQVRCWLRARPADGLLPCQARDLLATAVQVLLVDELSKLRGKIT